MARPRIGLGEMRWTAEVIRLDASTKIKVCYGPYLMGYYTKVETVEAMLQVHGYSMADLEIKE